MRTGTLLKLRGHHIFTYAAYILGLHSFESDKKMAGAKAKLFTYMHQTPKLHVQIVANEPDAVCDIRLPSGGYVCKKRCPECFATKAGTDVANIDTLNAKDVGFEIGKKYTVAELERKIKAYEAKTGTFSQTNDILNEAILCLEDKPPSKNKQKDNDP